MIHINLQNMMKLHKMYYSIFVSIEIFLVMD